MPDPTPRDLHVDQLLTQISIAFRNPNYIADMLFPPVPVRKQSDKIPKYDQSFWFRDQAVVRAPGTKSTGGGYKVNTADTYFSDRFSFRFEIPDELRDNQDDPFNVDRDGTEFVTDKMMMRREVAFATDFFTTSVWGTDKVGGVDFTVWSDYAGSNPLVDITGFKDEVEGLIGREARVMAMGKQVWVQLKWHPDLIDTIKYTQRGQISQEIAASLLELDKMLIGRAIQTVSPEGTAESSVAYTRIWGKNALLLHVPDRPSLLNPAAGYNFIWNRVAGAPQFMKRMRDEEREVDILEGNSYFDQKLTVANAGLFMSGAVA
jgi:hypothetical protein